MVNLIIVPTSDHTGKNTFENSNYINIFDPLFYTEFLTDHNANRISAGEHKAYNLRGHQSQGYNIRPYTQGINEQIQTPVNNADYNMKGKTLLNKASEVKVQRANYGSDSNSQNHSHEASNVESKRNVTSDNHHHHGPNGELIIHDHHHNVINIENNTNATQTVAQHSNMNHFADSLLRKTHDNQKSLVKEQTQDNKLNHHYLRYIIDQASRPVQSQYQNRGDADNSDFLRYIVDQASRPVSSHYHDRGNPENYTFLRYIVDQASRPVNSVYQNRESHFLNLIRCKYISYFLYFILK